MARKKRRRNKPRDPSSIPPEEVLDAIPGTGGVLFDLAGNLGVTRSAAKFLLRRSGPAWDEVRDSWREESEVLADAARNTLREMIEQREDLALAARSAKWYLERKEEEFVPKARQSVQVEDVTERLPESVYVEDLGLPLEVRKQILEAIRRKAEESEE